MGCEWASVLLRGGWSCISRTSVESMNRVGMLLWASRSSKRVDLSSSVRSARFPSSGRQRSLGKVESRSNSASSWFENWWSLGSCSFKIQIVKNEVDVNKLRGEGNQFIFERTARILPTKIRVVIFELLPQKFDQRHQIFLLKPWLLRIGWFPF